MEDIMTNDTLDAIIIEDSYPDRLRMRLLLSQLNFKFAWNAETNSVVDSETIMLMLNKYLPSRLVIDLAWSVEDDRQISKLRFKDVAQIKAIEKEHLNKKWIGGIDLISKLIEHGEDENEDDPILALDKIIIISKYIRPVSYGLWTFLSEKLNQINGVSYSFISKWSEEKRFKQIML